MIKTQCQSPHLVLWLSAFKTCRWCQLGFQIEELEDSQDHVERDAEQILQIDNAADCTGRLR